MPERVSNSTERNSLIDPIPPKAIPATTSTVVLGSVANSGREYIKRRIQNVGANDCYYAFGIDNCNNTNFNGVLAKATTVDANGYGSGGEIDLSSYAGQVSVYAATGVTTIASFVVIRNDLGHGQGNILTANPR